jgi:sortase A
MVIRVRAQSLWKLLLRAVSDLLILAGTAGVLVWAWGMFEAALYQHVQKTQFEQDRAEVSELPAVAHAPPDPRRDPVLKGRVSKANLVSPWLFDRDPQLLGEIDVPRLEWNVMVREGMDDATLRKAAGHVPATAFPGEPGNFVVLGHRDTLFRPLRGLEQGDRVLVRTMDGNFDYSIDSIEVVPPEQVTLLGGPAERSITLVTCFPFDFVGPAPRRFVARGHLNESSGR